MLDLLHGKVAIASALGVGRETVLQFMAAGAPIHRIGGDYYANEDALYQWLAKAGGK